MPSSRQMTGTSQEDNCDVYETDNASCEVTVNEFDSFGPSFNMAGGGWYAIERTPSFIMVYFWSRWCPTVPDDVSSPGPMINTDSWGEPAAYYPSGQSCDFATHLGAFNITTFVSGFSPTGVSDILSALLHCVGGAWAGRVYNESGCPSTCTNYVNSNPVAFKDAYFTFNGLTIYE